MTRALGVAFRTVHLVGFGVLLGGHVLGVDPARLVPWLAVTLASGVALVAVEVARGVAWCSTVAGLSVFLKLGLLAALPALWEHRASLLLLVAVLSSVTSHMPKRLRRYQLVPALRTTVP